MSVMAQLFLMSVACAAAGAIYFHRATKAARSKYGAPPIDAPAHEDAHTAAP